MAESFAKSVGIGTPRDITSIHTPFMLLDFSLGGGIASGQWIEIFGPEGVGKTTLALKVGSFMIEADPNCYLLYIDTEKAMSFERIQDVFYQKNVEINDETGQITIDGIERGALLSPDTYEQIDVIFNQFCSYCMKNNMSGILVWDSLVTATSERLIKEGKERIGWKATAIQTLIEKYNAIFQKVPVTQLVINQVRAKIGENMFSQDKGEGEMGDGDYSVPGGYAHKFASSQTVQLVKSTKWKFPQTTPLCEGRTVRMIPTKNKLGNPRREVKHVLVFEPGYSNVVSILEYFSANKMLEGKALSSIKITGFTALEKGVSLPKFCDMLVSDDAFLDAFFNFSFDFCVAQFKSYSKLHRFNKELMKKAIRMDADRMARYFESLKETAAIDIEAAINQDLANVPDSTNDMFALLNGTGSFQKGQSEETVDDSDDTESSNGETTQTVGKRGRKKASA